jgi:hypothetical protein
MPEQYVKNIVKDANHGTLDGYVRSRCDCLCCEAAASAAGLPLRSAGSTKT